MGTYHRAAELVENPIAAQLLRNLPFSTADIALTLLDITWA
jgi:hypothetical protein